MSATAVLIVFVMVIRMVATMLMFPAVAVLIMLMHCVYRLYFHCMNAILLYTAMVLERNQQQRIGWTPFTSRSGIA